MMNSPEEKSSGKLPGTTHTEEARSVRIGMKIDPAPGGISISELFANTGKYKDRMVKIRGIVTRVNESIMGKNWIHLQDGTSSGEMYDLTVTSSALPPKGSIVTASGKITTDRNFGYGYTYKVMMEDASITDEGSFHHGI